MVSYIAHCRSDYYQCNKRVFVDKRLPGMEYSQAGILYEPAAEFLVSYETIVAELTADGWVHVYCIPSRSTAKHIGKWGRLHNLDYFFLKDLYLRNREYNIYTLEYRDAIPAMIRTIGVAV